MQLRRSGEAVITLFSIARTDRSGVGDGGEVEDGAADLPDNLLESFHVLADPGGQRGHGGGPLFGLDFRTGPTRHQRCIAPLRPRPSRTFLDKLIMVRCSIPAWVSDLRRRGASG